MLIIPVYARFWVKLSIGKEYLSLKKLMTSILIINKTPFLYAPELILRGKDTSIDGLLVVPPFHPLDRSFEVYPWLLSCSKWFYVLPTT